MISMKYTNSSIRHDALIAMLTDAREAAGMTQAELASRLGVYQSLIARLESGQRRVDVIEFLEIARVLGFDPGEMLADVRRFGSKSGAEVS